MFRKTPSMGPWMAAIIPATQSVDALIRAKSTRLQDGPRPILCASMAFGYPITGSLPRRFRWGFWGGTMIPYPGAFSAEA